jgi:hypothetical protein
MFPRKSANFVKLIMVTVLLFVLHQMFGESGAMKSQSKLQSNI